MRRLSLIFFLGFLLIPLSLSVADSTVIRVNLDLLSARHTEEEIRALLPLRVGDPYSAEKLEEAKVKLMKAGLFEEVAITSRPAGVGSRPR